MKPHKHAEWIKAKADGHMIQESFPKSLNWLDMSASDWDFSDDLIYRIKPAAPKWPETTMTNLEINTIIATDESHIVGYSATETGRRIANAALRHSVETGQLVLPDPDRDMKIALAVRNHIRNMFTHARNPNSNQTQNATIYGRISGIQLEQIIKGATE